MGGNEHLETGAARSRRLDTELSAELGRPAPTGAATSAGYVTGLTERPALRPEEERRLVAMAQDGDAAAREQLVERLLPLVVRASSAYRSTPSIQRLELVQEGVVGLLRALDRYDPERGVPFWAYATWWVRQAMQQLVAELTRPLVLSDRALRNLSRLKDAHRASVRETGHEPGRDALAARTGLSGEQVDDLIAVDAPARSLQEPVGDGDGAVGVFGDLLADPLAEDEYERVLESLQIEQLLALLAGLSDRERDILRARYGLDGREESLRAIADRLGLSAERVRQLEQRALGKLAAAAGVQR
jgi:RNA polymerase sigma factor (sigma-70 family)